MESRQLETRQQVMSPTGNSPTGKVANKKSRQLNKIALICLYLKDKYKFIGFKVFEIQNTFQSF